MRDQAQRLRELASQARGTAGLGATGGGRVLAVASGKGGVGKTSLAANLGVVLSRRGHSVTVIDADLGLANLDILLNLSPRRNLGHVVRGEASAEEVTIDLAPGLRVVPGASGIEALADLEETRRAGLLAALAPLTEDREFVLVDTAAGIGRNVVALCLSSQEVILVTNPEPTSLADAYGLVKVLRRQRADVSIRLVVNSVSGPGEGRSVHARLDQVVQRFLGGRICYLGHIELDHHVGQAALRQLPFVTAYPRCPASRCVETIADGLAGRAPRPGGAAQGFWQRLLTLEAKETQ